MNVDENVADALACWVTMGLEPGSFTMACLRGDLKAAHASAHAILKRDKLIPAHMSFVKRLVPRAARGNNVNIWRDHQGLLGIDPDHRLALMAVMNKLQGNKPFWWDVRTKRMMNRD